MSITLDTFLTRIALDLHEENNTFPTGLWTVPEMIGYINYAERDFLRSTGINKVDESVAVPPGTVILFEKPDNVMDIDRISFNGKRLRRVTSWDLEREDPEWRDHVTGNPSYYHEDHLNVNYFEFNKVPAAGGTYRMFSDKLSVEHTTDLTEIIAVEDCWEPYIRWCVLSLALSKDGDNQDLARSAYAYQRYLLGVSLARRLVLGTSVIPFPGA